MKYLMHTIVPEGKKGVAEVKHFEISQSAASLAATYAVAHGRPWEVITPGKYCSLRVNGELVMSDTQMEHVTNSAFLQAAHGRVLIAGLGVGFIVLPLLERTNITEVLVIEKHQDVIDLVHPHIQHDKLQVICADIWDWEPEGAFDTIYADVWADMNPDNYNDMVLLKNKFRPYLRSSDSWLGCWSESILKRLLGYLENLSC